jgi:hypothetical protein
MQARSALALDLLQYRHGMNQPDRMQFAQPTVIPVGFECGKSDRA